MFRRSWATERLKAVPNWPGFWNSWRVAMIGAVRQGGVRLRPRAAQVVAPVPPDMLAMTLWSDISRVRRFGVLRWWMLTTFQAW